VEELLNKIDEYEEKLKLMRKYFKQIKAPSEMFASYLLLVQQTPEEMWEDYFNFRALPIPKFTWGEEPFFHALSERHEFQVGIVKMAPNHFYRWHKDSERKVSVNMLLSERGKDYCLFKDHDLINGPVVELPYAPKTMYLFNTQQEHCVYNGEGDRFLLTIEFDGDETYLSLLEELEDRFWLTP